jgi:hypothetical protein
VETVTLEFAAVRVPVRAAEAPIATFPKFIVEGETVICGPPLPLPVSDTGRTGFEASLMIAILPDTDPLDTGEKSIPRVTLSPAASTSGIAGALPMRKPAPVTLMLERVMLDPSVAALLTAIELERVPPTGTAPNWTADAAFNRLLELIPEEPFGAVAVPPHPASNVIAASNIPRLYRFGIDRCAPESNYQEIAELAVESENACSWEG